MPTKSIRMTDEEADELQRLLAATGEDEDIVLHRAALRGLRALRLDEGIRVFQEGRGSSEAAAVAGLPRAVFLQTLIDQGVVVLDGPSSLTDELDGLADEFGDNRLRELAQRLGSESS